MNWQSYAAGTSFSAPYLAAAAYIALAGFKKGYSDRGGNIDLLSQDDIEDLQLYNKIYSILKTSSSRTTHQIKLGWGFVDILSAYNVGWATGFNYYTPPPPPPGCSNCI